jgi:dTDP-4-dehydrorhamnose 3,5-epimerase
MFRPHSTFNMTANFGRRTPKAPCSDPLDEDPSLWYGQKLSNLRSVRARLYRGHCHVNMINTAPLIDAAGDYFVYSYAMRDVSGPSPVQVECNKVHESLSMSVDSADLPRLIVPKRHVDDRGWFSETFNERRLGDIGIACHFVQDNQASSKRAGTVRGFHFQLPPVAQAKLLSVLRGRILDVAVDVRRGSPSFGKYISVELSAESREQVYIPVGFAHGYISLEEDVLVMYKVSKYYAPAHDSGIRWNDRDIAFPWPFDDSEIITSEKDSRLPFLKEFTSPFDYDDHPLEDLMVSDLG